MKINPVTLAFGAPIEQRPTTAVIHVAVALDRVNDRQGLPMTDHKRAEVETGYELAYVNLTRGTGSAESMDFIVTALNVALVLAEMGYAPEYLDLIVRAQEGAFRAVQRGLASDRWAFNGADIPTIREALDVHSAQLDVATKMDIKGALAVIEHRKKNGVVYAQEPA